MMAWNKIFCTKHNNSNSSFYVSKYDVPASSRYATPHSNVCNITVHLSTSSSDFTSRSVLKSICGHQGFWTIARLIWRPYDWQLGSFCPSRCISSISLYFFFFSSLYGQGKIPKFWHEMPLEKRSPNYLYSNWWQEHRVGVTSNCPEKRPFFFKYFSLSMWQNYSPLQTICSSFMFPPEFAATTIFDFLLQQTLETNCPLSSLVSCPVIGSVKPKLWEVIGMGRVL